MSDRGPALLAQQKPLGRRCCCDNQRADENPALPAIAAKDRRRHMKEAEDEKEAHHQPKPVGSRLNLR